MTSPRAIVVDVRDATLGAAERVVAVSAGEDVLRGLGRAALAHPRATLFIESDDRGAAEGLAEAAARMSAQVTLRPPSNAVALRLRPTRLVEDAWRAAGRADARVVAIAGAVERPRVLLVAPDTRVDALVAAARPTVRAWVAMWGGAGGALVDRDDRLDTLDDDAARLVLVLPSAHTLARRARTPISSWLRRSRSACASCAMCTPACPESLPVHEMLRVVSAGPRRAFRASRVAAAVDCTACGACDLACPQQLSPARVVDQLGRKLSAGGVVAPPRRRRVVPRLDEDRAILRLGLARYAGRAATALEALVDLAPPQ